MTPVLSVPCCWAATMGPLVVLSMYCLCVWITRWSEWAGPESPDTSYTTSTGSEGFRPACRTFRHFHSPSCFTSANLFSQFLYFVDHLPGNALVQHVLRGRGVQEDEEVPASMSSVARWEGGVHCVCQLEKMTYWDAKNNYDRHTLISSVVSVCPWTMISPLVWKSRNWVSVSATRITIDRVNTPSILTNPSLQGLMIWSLLWFEVCFESLPSLSVSGSSWPEMPSTTAVNEGVHSWGVAACLQFHVHLGMGALWLHNPSTCTQDLDVLSQV